MMVKHGVVSAWSFRVALLGLKFSFYHLCSGQCCQKHDLVKTSFTLQQPQHQCLMNYPVDLYPLQHQSGKSVSENVSPALPLQRNPPKVGCLLPPFHVTVPKCNVTLAPHHAQPS